MFLSDWFEQAQWWEIGLASAVLNFLTVTNSVILFRFLVKRRSVSGRIRTATSRDRLLAASTTVMNAIAILPPWWLWTRGTLEFTSPSVWLVLEVIYLALALDAAMYGLHRLFHQEVLFRWFHQIHHTDDHPPCDLTLFVMHPAEAAGFSVVVTVLMLAWPVSIPAVAIFFGLNLLIGTIAHVPQVSPGKLDNVLGGSRLHQTHHEDPKANFGFFTQFWDRALGTFR